MLLQAALLWNPNSEPIPDACVWIQGDQIRFAGPRRDLPEEAKSHRQNLDLGEVLLLPGLVNAHAHSELTALAGLQYQGDFVDWIREILRAKQGLDPQRQDQEMHEGVLRLLKGGTTTVADHLSVNANPEALLRSPLRGKAFIEVLGVVPEVATEMANAAELFRQNWGETPSRFELIPSPHSVHALAPEVLRRILQDVSKLHSIHLAESEAERRYFSEQAGTLWDFIAERGTSLERETSSSVQELDALGLLDRRILAVHGNYLQEGEIHLLATRRISLVHCPFSHAYFGHREFPMEACRRAGLNLALGTDSLASASTLSMLDVLRETEKKFPFLKREDIFSMATIGGAEALQMNFVGSLEAGKKADVIAVPLTGEAADCLFQAEELCFSMIDGEILTGF